MLLEKGIILLKINLQVDFMKIVITFVPDLYAFHLPNLEFDELERVLDEWEDPLFLFEFFSDNETDLNGEYTIEEAIEKQEMK